MITKKFLSDESGLTVALESVLLFAISVIFLGMIFYSFQDMNQRQGKILMEEELLTIGNSIAKQMSDLTVEARASNKLGSHTTITSEFWIPASIADSFYKVTLTAGKILLESTSPPYISIEVPVSDDIRLAENSTIYSNDERYTLEYDSLSSAIYFTNGGVVPFPDFNAPTISIDAPPEGETLSGYEYINVTVWDDVGVTRVEYYVNGLYKYSAGSPYNWLWDTLGELDGDYTVTAVAYDAAGHTKPAVRNFTISNPFTTPPAITIISPSDGENTTFKRPIIQALITDDKALDFSSIRLWIDGVNQTANTTFATIPPKQTTLTYTPLKNMAESPPSHNVKIEVKDLNTTPEPANRTWSFNISNVTDSAPPTATIVYPTGATPLAPGSSIDVTYLAYDLADSGIDNLTINVRRSDGVIYTYYEQVSIYPNVVYSIDPQETWPFNSTYVGGMNYTYNITVYDRSGKSVISAVGPLTVALPGQSSELEVDTSANYTQSSGTRLRNIRIKDNISDSVYPVITKINVSWAPDSSEKIERVRFGGTNYWTGSMPNGSQVDITDYTTQSTFQSMDLYFSADIRGKTFTLVFLLGDSTTSTVTFKAAS